MQFCIKLTNALESARAKRNFVQNYSMHFTTALQTVLRRSFGDKIAALAASAEMHSPDIGKLLREEVPLTAAKLAKLLKACEDEDDRSLLIHAAVRDYIGEEEYQSRFCNYQPATEHLVHESSLGGPSFHAQFPIDPRAEQVLRYLVNNVQHNGDVSAALILLGKFLELPAAEPTQKPDVLFKLSIDPPQQANDSGKRPKSA
jgi:hypothetical protein